MKTEEECVLCCLLVVGDNTTGLGFSLTWNLDWLLTDFTGLGEALLAIYYTRLISSDCTFFHTVF